MREERAVKREAPHTNGHIKEFSSKEGWKLFDAAAMYYLGITGKEFIEQLEAGRFDDPDEDVDVAEVLALLPFARS